MPANPLPPIAPTEKPKSPAFVTPLAVKPRKNPVVGIFIFLLIIGLIGGGVFEGMQFLNKQFVPGVSPVVEDLFQTPGQQLALRLDILSNASAVAAISALQKQNITVQTDISQADLAQYSSALQTQTNFFTYNLSFNGSLSPSAIAEASTTGSSVLGLKDAGGVIDTNFLQALSQTSSLAFQLTQSGTIDTRNTNSPKSAIQTTASVTVGSKTLGVGIDTKSLNNTLYAKLNYYPDNDFVDLSSLQGKWVQTAVPSGATALETANQVVAVPTTQTIKINKSDLQKLQAIFRLSILQKNVTHAASQSIAGVPAKCYNISLSGTDLPQFINQAYRTADPTATDTIITSSTLPTDTVITLCFPNSGVIPGKATVSLTSTQDATSRTVISFDWSAATAASDITAPTTPLVQLTSLDPLTLLKPAGKEYAASLVAEMVGSTWQLTQNGTGTAIRTGQKVTVQYKEVTDTLPIPAAFATALSKTFTYTAGSSKLMYQWQRMTAGAHVGDHYLLSVRAASAVGDPAPAFGVRPKYLVAYEVIIVSAK